MITSVSTHAAQKETFVYTSSLDKSIRVWNEKGECTKVLDTSEQCGWVWQIVLSSDRIYMAGQHGLKIYNLANVKWVPLNFEGHSKQISCLTVKGDVVHTGSWDTTIRGWKERGRSWRTISSTNTNNLKEIEKYYSNNRTGSFAMQRSGSGSGLNIPQPKSDSPPGGTSKSFVVLKEKK